MDQKKYSSNKIIARHLTESGAFSDVEPRVLVASGKSFTPFFINTEKLTRDPTINDFLNKNEKRPEAIVKKSIDSYIKNKDFKEVIDIMAKEISDSLHQQIPNYFSGGMRRDILFSAPISHFFNAIHLSLVKPGDAESPVYISKTIPRDLITKKPETTTSISKNLFLNSPVVHVADLLTSASSCFNYSTKTGWIPRLRIAGANTNNLFSVVSRLQGGEENLQVAGVKAKSFVYIDEDYIKEHSKQPETCLKYLEDEVEDTKKYILEKGVEVIVPFADPATKKFSATKKFLGLYKGFLEEHKLINHLKIRISERYGPQTTENLFGQ